MVVSFVTLSLCHLWQSRVTFLPKFQYPAYADAYLRLAAIAKARNNVQLSNELVVVLSFYPYMQTIFH